MSSAADDAYFRSPVMTDSNPDGLTIRASRSASLGRGWNTFAYASTIAARWRGVSTVSAS